ncbi:hypothetical protein, partial [Ralstonia solanacearum]
GSQEAWRTEKVFVERDGVAIPGSAVFLENVLLKTANEEEADELLAVISSEYAQACLDDLQLEVDRERVRRSPKRVLALIGLANCLSHRWLDVSALRKAKEVVESTVQNVFE